MIKKIISTVFAATLVSFFILTGIAKFSYAQTVNDNTTPSSSMQNDANMESPKLQIRRFHSGPGGMDMCLGLMHERMMKKMIMMGQGGFLNPIRDIGLMQPKNLTADDAKIIAQASLLMYNRKDLQVGDISEKNVRNRTFYLIPINDMKGNLVTTVIMNKDTGMMRPMPRRFKQNAADSSATDNPAS